MRANVLFDKLREGNVTLGINNMYPASGIIEGMCKGWDFVWIDAQHGQHSRQSVLHAVQAAMAVGVETLIRVPGHEYGILGPYADLAPSAIMVPMVNTVEQAHTIVQGLRFAPLGNRSYGGRRVIDLDGRDYYRERELLVVAQIETLEAAANAAAIIQQDGIDVLFYGPDDMKVQMGLPINTQITESDELMRGLESTAKAAKEAGKFCGCVAGTKEALEMTVGMGYQLIACGGDITFLRVAAADRLAEFRALVDQRIAAP